MSSPQSSPSSSKRSSSNHRRHSVTTNRSLNDRQILKYSFSTLESDVGKVCWKITDSENRLVWKSARELVEDEIVESIRNSTGEAQWTIHKPTRGWYLVLHSQHGKELPKSIQLQPVCSGNDPSDPIQFHFRLHTQEVPRESGSKTTGSHLKRRSGSIVLNSASTDNSKLSSSFPQSEYLILLKPQVPNPTEASLFKSFIQLFANSNRPFTCFARSHDGTESIIFDYQDNSSTFGIQSFGTLLIYHEDETYKSLDLDKAFWVAVCIAYLGFRDDQEAFVAANQDN
ncbi:hypothetical protein O181_070152 [Austropuccinia psidii MF-1]|uniref:Uncharacterized protein n=1 Tax=Austropuccinia psidii MF-1 TaxID=1389203 RepID=A0A9Q3F2N1_9BASI|nr:hypothetical protein [Austropuccinia psidii MF-1]